MLFEAEMKEGACGYAHIIRLRHLSMSLICHSGFLLRATRTDKRHTAREQLTKFSALFSDFPINFAVVTINSFLTTVCVF